MKVNFPFRPKLVDTLKNYSAQDFAADLTAGIIVGIVALPLSLALAIASGLKPEVGLFTAIVGGFLVSLLGGSRVQIGGPAGAFVPLLAPIVVMIGRGGRAFGPEGLVVCAMMAGVILFVLGACRLGTMIKYIPFPVVTGFTSGIAVIIMSTQIRDFFGLPQKLPPDFIGKLHALAESFQPNWPTVLLATVSTLAIWFWPKKIGKRLPGSIVVILLASVASVYFGFNKNFGIQTLGTAFGEMPRSLPLPHWPSLTFHEWRALLPAAMTVAVLGAIESLLSAVVADGMIDDRHDSNQELMGQGVANVVVGIFGGMPTTGVIARTAANVRSGGRTPVAGIIHALTVLAVLLVAAPFAKVSSAGGVERGAGGGFVAHGRMAPVCAAEPLAEKRRDDFSVRVHFDGGFEPAYGGGRIIDSRVGADGETAGGDGPCGARCGGDPGRFAGPADGRESHSGRRAGVPRFRRVLFRCGGQIGVVAAPRGRTAGGFDFADARRAGAGRDRTGRAGGFDGEIADQEEGPDPVRPHSQPLFALTRAGFMERLGEQNVCGDMESSLARAWQLMEQKKNKKVIDS